MMYKNFKGETVKGEFVPKSEKDEFQLLQLGNKVDTIIDDAISCPLDDGMLTIHIKDKDVLKKYSDIQCNIMYGELSRKELIAKIYESINLIKDYKISLYIIAHKLILALNIRKRQNKEYNGNVIDEVKEVITNIINNQPSATIDGDSVIINQPAVNNTLPSTPVGIINNINNNNYLTDTEAIKWLKDNITFMPDMTNVPISTAKNLSMIFNNQYVIALANNYGLIPTPEGKIYKQLDKTDYDSNNEYSYAFGASCIYPDKYIVLLVNTDNMKFKIEHVNK